MARGEESIGWLLVVRNSNGDWIKGFIASFDYSTALGVEIWTILKGIKFVKTSLKEVLSFSKCNAGKQ